MFVNHELFIKVQHPKVTSGQLASEYERPPTQSTDYWRPAWQLPLQHTINKGRFTPKYTLYTEMINDMFSRLVDFDLEAWREIRLGGSASLMDLRAFELIYASTGSSPQKVPLWGPSKIDLEKVFRVNALSREQLLGNHHYGQDPWMRNTRKDHHHTHVWIGHESPAPFPQGMRQEIRELVNIFGYPFYLYERGKWDKPKETDPYRMHLRVGVGRYIPPAERWPIISLMAATGELHKKDLEFFTKAAGRQRSER